MKTKRLKTLGAISTLLAMSACIGEVADENEVSLDLDMETFELSGNPYEQCAAILADGLKNQMLTSENRTTAGVLTDYKCDEYNRNGKVDTSYWGWGVVNADGAYEEARKVCETTQRPYVASSFTTYALNLIADQGVVNAWRECMRERAQGLFCEPRHEGELIRFYTDWKTTAPRELSLSWDALVNVTPTSTLPAKLTAEGRKTLGFRINNPKKQSMIIMNAEGKAGAFSCDVAINPPPSPRERPKPKLDFDLYLDVDGRGTLSGGPNTWVGTKKESRRVTHMSVELDPYWPSCLDLQYRAHVQDKGDMNWVKAPETVGVNNKRMEAVAFKLSGQCAKDYTLEYSCHIQDQGDVTVKEPGKFCGTSGKSKRLEAVKLIVRKKEK